MGRPDGTEPAARAQIILAARVGRESSAPAETAAWLATALDADLTVLYIAVELDDSSQVATAGGLDEDEVRAQMTADARRRAEEWGRSVLAGRPFDVRVEAGAVAETVAAVAAEMEATLVVVGSEGRGALRGMILGDTTRDILRRSSRPVVVVPAGSTRR